MLHEITQRWLLLFIKNPESDVQEKIQNSDGWLVFMAVCNCHFNRMSKNNSNSYYCINNLCKSAHASQL